MKEYIERAKVLESLGYEENRWGDVLPGSTFDIILKEPAADVVEVRHGRWLLDGRCSECLANPLTTHKNYCPNCGAFMQEEGNGEK